jgi:hypothetical protein
VSETLPPPEPAPLPAARRAPFRLPGQYYEAPVSEVTPVFHKWVPYGCGSAAIAFVVLLFIGGAFAGKGGVGPLLDFAFGMMEKELEAGYAPDATPSQRTAFESEYNKLRTNLRANRLDLARVQTLLRSISDAQEDKKLTGSELQRLTKDMQELNGRARR